MGRRLGGELYSGVQRHHAPGVEPQWVDIQFDQFVQVDHHLRDLDQGQRHGVEVDTAQQAVAQALIDAGLRHDLARQVHVERRQAVGHVVDDLGFRSALAETDHGAKSLAGAYAQSDFVGALPGDDGLEREAIEFGRRCHGVQLRKHGGGGLTDRFGAVQITHDSADLRFRADVRRHDLQGHGLAQPGGDGLGLGRRVGELGFRDRDAVGGQQLHGLVLVEVATAAGQRVGDQGSRRGDVGGELLW